MRHKGQSAFLHVQQSPLGCVELGQGLYAISRSAKSHAWDLGSDTGLMVDGVEW